MNKDFYYKWLRMACVLTIVTGVVSLLASHPTTETLWRAFIFALSGFSKDYDFNSTARGISAVLGGVMIGWGWMMFCLSHPKTFNASVRTIFISTLILWFITDSIGSYVSGLSFNIAVNLLFFFLFLIPLWQLKVN
jgi:hypothetical protein